MYSKTIRLEKEISKDRLKKIVNAIELISGWFIDTCLVNEKKIVLGSDSENRLNDLVEFWNIIEK